MAEINGKIKPRLSDLYDRSSSLLSKRGHGIVDRAIKKGTVGGDVGMQLLFEPAMLLSLVATEDVLHSLAVVAKDIPFIGNYGLWSPCEATIAAAHRLLTTSGDARAADVELWLSLPENGGHPGPPVIHTAMTNRLNGLLVEQIRSDAYTPPLKLPQFSYAIAKLRELTVMWAFGGSEAWSRSRIDEGISGIRLQLSDFLQ
ncbi:hypothetical protein [Mycobacteroides abscessus]|nr:hypothetical protein [Mycobacteroides abscessus]